MSPTQSPQHPSAAQGQPTLRGHFGGDARVRFLRVVRQAIHHELHDWTVGLCPVWPGLAHDESTRSLPPDALEEMIYRVARQSEADSVEAFALELLALLFDSHPQTDAAEVHVASHLWKRLAIDGKPCPMAFMQGSAELQTTHIEQHRHGALQIRSGFSGMTLVHTAPSTTAGAVQDDPRTSPRLHDHLLHTEVSATWEYTSSALAADVTFNQERRAMREQMLATYARNSAMGTQQILHAMGNAALERTTAVDELLLHMSVKRNVPVALDGLELSAAKSIFLRTHEPDGVVEAVVRRGER